MHQDKGRVSYSQSSFWPLEKKETQVKSGTFIICKGCLSSIDLNESPLCKKCSGSEMRNE